MKSSAKNIVLKSVDDIFQTEENRADAQRERVQEIPLDQLKPFKNHPFKVRDDQRMLDTVDSIREYGVLVPAIARPDPEGGYELIRQHGDVRMKDVDFSYVDGKPVQQDITLYAEPGQKVAFVGATGAGKTTITNLINRFYDIADGKIRYDGININKIRKSDLRRSLGIVLQETNLFTGSVMDNIRYGKKNATKEEVIEAAKNANAHEFIVNLPNGYDTLVGERGATLSGGERQRIAIARAILKNAPILILDEATSSVDCKNEQEIQNALKEAMKDRTTLVIAHRMTTIEDADRIYVMQNGCVEGCGTHEELLQKDQIYQNLVRAQSYE